VVTRRGLLAAGGLALLAGCGKDDAAAPLPTAGDALLRQLAAERSLAAALDGLDAPPAGRETVRRLAARADARVERLAAAVSAEGGRPHDAPAPEGGAAGPDAAIDRSRAALEAHVEGIQWLGGDELRRLGSRMVTESATDLTVLGGVFGTSTTEAFPGVPA
jgi:hypothetical protein